MKGDLSKGTCPHCGYKLPELLDPDRMPNRKWKCPSCGSELHILSREVKPGARCSVGYLRSLIEGLPDDAHLVGLMMPRIPGGSGVGGFAVEALTIGDDGAPGKHRGLVIVFGEIPDMARGFGAFGNHDDEDEDEERPDWLPRP